MARFPDYAGEFPAINPRTSSPGAIGAWKVWTDISNPAAPVLKCRDASNASDLVLSGGGGGGTSFTLRSGAGAPSVGLGIDGDWYFDTSTGDAYTKASGAWSKKVDLGTAALLNVPAAGNAASGEVVKGNDSRLSDTRTPVAHTHPSTDVNDSTAAGRALLTAATVAAQRTALGMGTAALVNVPAAGNAAVGEVVKGSDTRLTDTRTPTAHTHVAADVTGGTFATALLGSGGASAAKYLRGDSAWQAIDVAEVANAVDVRLVDAKGDLLVGSADNTLGRLAVGADRQVLVADSAQALGLGFGRAPENLPRSGVNGWYTSYMPAGRTTGAPPLNELRVTPLWVSKATTFVSIGAEVTVAGTAGSVVHLVIYADDGNGYPGALIVDAGTIDGTVVGSQRIAISQALAPGLYWIGAVAQVAVPTMRSHPTVPGFLPLPQVYGTSLSLTLVFQGYAQASVSGTPPATFSTSIFAVASSSSLPVVGVRAA